MISLKNINLGYKTPLIIDGRMLLSPGQLVVICGESGCGKTTLLKLIGLLFDHLQADYDYEGISVNQLNKNQRADFRFQHIAYIAQDIVLLEDMSVLDNMRFFAQLYSLEESETQFIKRLDEVQLHIDLQQNVSQLSVGERQRLSIVCGLLKEAEIFLFDEPGAYLDRENKQFIISVMDNLIQQHKIVVVASHENIFKESAHIVYEIKNQHLNLIKDESHECERKQLPIKKCSFLALKNYVHQSIKIHLSKHLIHCLFVSMIMIFIVSLLNFKHYQTLKLGDDLLNLMNHTIIVGKSDKSYIKPKEQAELVSCFPQNNLYALLEIGVYIEGYENLTVIIRPYLPFDSAIPETIEQDDSSNIYISYTLHRHLKTDEFIVTTYEGITSSIKTHNIVSPSVDNQDNIIYVPYSALSNYLKQDMIYYDTQKIFIEIKSLDEIEIVKNQLPATMITGLDSTIQSNYQIYKIMTSPYMYFIACISLIILFIYNIFGLIKKKLFFGFLESHGINMMNMMKMKSYENGFLLIIQFFINCLFVMLVLIVLDIFQIQFYIQILLYGTGLEIIYSFIDILCFIVMLKRQSIASLLS